MKISLVLALLSCTCMWLVICRSEVAGSSGASHQSDELLILQQNNNELSGQLALHHREKRFLEALVSGVVGIIGNLFGRNKGPDMSKFYEKQMGFQLEQLCLQTCVTEWSPWSLCSKPCGGGITNRSRTHQISGRCKGLNGFVCPHGTSQSASCNQGCPNGGQPSGGGCTCQDGWKGNCCGSQVKCVYPGKPRNGQCVGRWPAIFGSIATFSCEDGFYLNGEEMLECQADGKWTHNGAIPKCQRIMCSMPKENPHITIMNRESEYMYGDQIMYRCDNGYILNGPATRTCVKRNGATGKWNGFDPFCSTVNCGDPGLPAYGQRNGTDFGFGGVVTFSCGSGYKLMGYQSLKCMATGHWLGKTPTCIQITCDPPFVPKNGAARVKSKSFYGSLVTFSCDPGYILEGSKLLQCQADGNWNGTEPICKPSSCPDPGIPLNGAKDGSVYFFPNNVTYSCYTGYTLKGKKSISCQSNGQWSSSKPTCEEIKCPKQYAPMNGTIDNCGNKMGDMCNFDCIDGYFIDKGTSSRTCQENAEWDGAEAHCSACPINTYKSDQGSCLPCPVDSNTNDTEGNMKEGCVCDKGFQGDNGGPCTDINECLANNGKGPCEDTCENRKGGYKCGCSIPGYKLSDDDLNCEVEKQCKNLTKADAPDNGGLVCHWFRQENSQQCGVRCNKGHEFPSRVNNYETCGPTTGYHWSFRLENKNAAIAACIAEFFPGFKTESDIFYFTKECDSLTDKDKNTVYSKFKDVLDKQGVCKRHSTKVCNIQNMGIICGRKVKVRTKRGVLEEISAVNIGFDLQSIKIGDNPHEDCPRICVCLRIPKHLCGSLCVSAYKRFIQAAVVHARTQLRDIYKDGKKRRNMNFAAAGRDFETTQRIKQGKVNIQCAPGMKGDSEKGWCVPCEAGTFWNGIVKECQSCPPGTYQPFKNQTECFQCPLGSTTTKPASYFCKLCPCGTWGEKCAQKCECVNGICEPQYGKCICQTGWTEDKCDIDIDGCAEPHCFPGVTCKDVPAPGVGFQCGSCPAGFRGDGIKCQQITEL